MSSSSAVTPSARMSAHALPLVLSDVANPGMVKAEDVGARKLQAVEGARGDEQRMARVEPARYADHHVLQAGGFQALAQSLHLDVEGLEAVEVELGRVVGDEGEAIDRAHEPHVGIARGVLEHDVAERALRMPRGRRPPN